MDDRGARHHPRRDADAARREEEHTLHGIQLWTTLPRALKSMAPRYQNLAADAIPAVTRRGRDRARDRRRASRARRARARR